MRFTSRWNWNLENVGKFGKIWKCWLLKDVFHDYDIGILSALPCFERQK